MMTIMTMRSAILTIAYYISGLFLGQAIITEAGSDC